MDIRDLFKSKSDIYAGARPRYPVALYEWLSNVCDDRNAVWDAACGNGQAAADLINFFDFVEASDISPSQIEAAPFIESVRFTVQASEDTSFDPDRFDAVCVAQALHWFELGRFWPEVKRVLKPRGIFAAWGYNWPRIEPGLDHALEESFLSIVKPYWSPRNRLLWDGYRSISLPFDRIETPKLGLVMNWDVDEFFTFLHSWSATRLCMNEIGEDFFFRSREVIHSLWGSENLRKVSMEFVIVAGRNGT